MLKYNLLIAINRFDAIEFLSVFLPSGNDVASSLTYAYDQNKNLTQETFGGGATATYSATMQQDAKDRLIAQTRTSGQAQVWNLTKEGDWASATSNGVVETRSHNANHQVIGLSSTTNNPTYDAQGDLAKDEQGRAYAWDQEKNLKTISTSGSTTFGATYDALGRRVSKTENGQMTVYISSGNQEVAEYANGASSANPSKDHVYGTYVDEAIATVNADGSKHYRVMDRRYSTVALLDQVGNVLQRFIYDAYGKTTVLSASGVVQAVAPLTDILWTGRRLDGSGNYYFRSRYFSTKLGRFISRDVDYLDGANLYEGYFSGRFKQDPTGKWCCDKCTKEGELGEAEGAMEIRITASTFDPASLEVANNVNGMVGLIGAAGSLPDFIAEAVNSASQLPDLTNVYVHWANMAAGNFSGWTVWVRVPHYVCRRVSCFVFWDHLDLVLEDTDASKKSSWQKSSCGDLGPDFPGIFGSLKDAIAESQKCADEIFQKMYGYH